MEYRPLLRRYVPVVLGVAVLLGLVWRQVSRDTSWQDYLPGELARQLEQARTFQDNLRVALEPAFRPMALAYTQSKYQPSRVEIAVRSISVRRDGRFPVTVEVTGTGKGVYIQEKFLFWWEGHGWRMAYLEGDV